MDKVTKDTIEQLEQLIASARKTQKAALIRSATEQYHAACDRLKTGRVRLAVVGTLGDGGLEIDVVPENSVSDELEKTLAHIRHELNDYVEILDNDFADFIIK